MKFSLRFSFVIAAIAGASAYIFGTGLTVTSAWLITMASQHPPVLVLSVAVVMVRFFGIARSVARYAERVLSHEAVFSRLTELRVALYASIAARLQTSAASIGSLTKALVDDVERAEEFSLRISLPRIIATISLVTTGLIAWWIDIRVLLTLLPLILLSIFLIPYLSEHILDAHTKSVEESENDYAEILERTSGALVEAEVLGYANRFHDDLSARIESMSRHEVRGVKFTSRVQWLVLFSFGLTLGAMGLLVTQIDLVPVKVAMALFLPLVGFEASTAFFPNLFIGGRLRSAMNKVQEQQGSVNTAAVLTVNTCNELQVVDVQAMWDQPFTRPLSFTANKSDVVEIRGRSGCGKSTFAQSLLGLTHYQGEFLVDGVPLVHEGSRHLLVSGSLQRAHIFNTSLRENLKIAAPEASDELLQRIIDDLELATFTLDDVIGSYGRAISGGEAKRISVARALLSTTPIVVLDEPLEHLGRDLAMRVAQAITRYTEDRILIVITHTPWPKSTHTVEIHRQ